MFAGFRHREDRYHPTFGSRMSPQEICGGLIVDALLYQVAALSFLQRAIFPASANTPPFLADNAANLGL